MQLNAYKKINFGAEIVSRLTILLCIRRPVILQILTKY